MKKFFLSFIILGMFSSIQAENIIIDLNEKPITNGFADCGKLTYQAKKIVKIDDSSYPNPIDKRKAFTKAISSSDEMTIILSGDIDLSDGKVTDTDHSYFDKFDSAGKRLHTDFSYPISSKKTILGIDNAKIKFGGLKIPTGNNIIIRNITFWDAHGSTEISTKVKSDSKASADSLVIWDKKSSVPYDIWIDHCTFTDGTCIDMERNFNHDGSIDICGSKNLTISYCEFTNHDKVMLVGSGEIYTKTEERQVTLHHNYFHNTTQRLPRSRGTQMHIFNNVYDDIGVPTNKGYMFGPGTASQFIVENNYLGSHLGEIVSYFDSSTKENTISKFYQSGNSVTIKNSDVKWGGKVKDFNSHFVDSKDKMPWQIPYNYKMDNFNEALNDVKVNVGANKILEIK